MFAHHALPAVDFLQPHVRAPKGRDLAQNRARILFDEQSAVLHPVAQDETPVARSIHGGDFDLRIGTGEVVRTREGAADQARQMSAPRENEKIRSRRKKDDEAHMRARAIT